jgi:hypothetical protein
MAWFRGLPLARWALVLAVAAVVVMVAGVGLVGVGGSDPSPPVAAPGPSAAPPAANAAAGGPGPSNTAFGVGVGFERSEAGAVAAAVSYTAAPQSWLYLSDEDVAAGVEAVVVPEIRGDLAGEVVQEVRLLRTELEDATGTVWFVVSPLATRVEDYDGDAGRAVVRVWAVRVLSAAGVADPQSGWQTFTYRLRWHDSDWKIASIDETHGPVPQLEVGLQAWTADYLGSELDGFARVGIAP